MRSDTSLIPIAHSALMYLYLCVPQGFFLFRQLAGEERLQLTANLGIDQLSLFDLVLQ